MKRIAAVVAMIAVVAMFPVAARAESNEDLKYFSDTARWAIPLTAAGVTVFKGDWKGLLQLTESVVATQVVTEGLKELTREKRPDGRGFKSFPSGHVSGAFSGAAFVHRRYGFKWAAPLYAAATVVAYQRVEAKRHHVHDVIAGAALGIGLNWVFTTPLKKEVVVTPFVSEDGVGAMATIKW